MTAIPASAAAAATEVRIAIAYRRVSTGKQQRNGVSLEQQDAAANVWAQQHSYSVESRYVDEGMSGRRSENRSGLQAALRHACKVRGALVVYSFSRLARNVYELLAIAKQLQRAGADLVSTTQNIDTTTPMGKFFFTVLGAFDELAADITAQTVRDILQHKRSSKLKYGEVPFGLRVEAAADCGKHTRDAALACSCRLVRDKRDMRTLRLVRKLRERLGKWSRVAEELNRRGVKTKKGRNWSGQNLRKLMQQQQQ